MPAKNVIVDGSNLAYRTHHALKSIPQPLTDSEGNPTGLLFGFLRSLGSLVGRLEATSVYVVWDGSKGYRVGRYPQYKANRNSDNIFSDGQMGRVKQILPSLGVWQAYNPDEEADDVIASLVRGQLKGQQNVIVSTDRDFLQLVTFTDCVLIPKVGSKDEIVYDPDRVLAEYGVSPDKMVQLRALLGDSSDNLPGVPRVPEKALKGLLRTHSTVEGIYASNLAGLSASQYDKVKASKEQVLLNLELMALRQVQVSLTDSSPNPDVAKSMLSAWGIQSPLVDPFFRPLPKGFEKRS